jgi:hypothetical protein
MQRRISILIMHAFCPCPSFGVSLFPGFLAYIKRQGHQDNANADIDYGIHVQQHIAYLCLPSRRCFLRPTFSSRSFLRFIRLKDTFNKK